MTQRFVTPSVTGRADALAQAHARSREFGLRASEAPDFQPLQPLALRDLVERNRSLYAHALPVMETLHAQIVDTESMVLLTDSNGVILHSLGDSDFVEKAKRVALCPGVSWSEAHRGTNAVGTALAEGQPTVVHGSEHFLQANRVLTCSCAPIADPFGHTIGALDVSGDPRGFHKHTMALVRMSALMIENQLFANQFRDAMRVRFHARGEFIGTLFEGLAAFGDDGRLLAANRSALFQFERPLDALCAQPFEALFAVAFPAVLQQASRAPGECLTLTLPSGVRVLARAEYATRPAFSADARSQRAAMPASAPAPRRPRADLITFATLDTGDAHMAAVLNRVEKVRGRDVPLLVLGKTGTGKEWLARAMHEESPRRDAPFVAVNCASLPDTLIEAELFGYEDGAFTGARKRGSAGKIVQADGGTLFLDEIGDMPLAQQVRLMRVLQERAVVPLGGTRAVPVDVRIVCATHRNLRAMIEQGTFREDLYYRINGLVVTLPALAARTDLPVLVERILTRLRSSEPRSNEADSERMPARVSAPVLECFARCRWPGNLRQLANVLRTAGIMAEGAAEIGIEHLPEDFLHDCEPPLGEPAHVEPLPSGAQRTLSAEAQRLPSDAHPAPSQPARMEELQATLIGQTLARNNGNVSAAARELGLARNTVYRYMRMRGTH